MRARKQQQSQCLGCKATYINESRTHNLPLMYCVFRPHVKQFPIHLLFDWKQNCRHSKRNPEALFVLESLTLDTWVCGSVPSNPKRELPSFFSCSLGIFRLVTLFTQLLNLMEYFLTADPLTLYHYYKCYIWADSSWISTHQPDFLYSNDARFWRKSYLLEFWFTFERSVIILHPFAH